jgi:Fic family protein
MHAGGYDIKGLYSLEEYYARDLTAYYQAISIGPSHNYYMGRADADITPWIEYFISGVAFSFEKILATMQHKVGEEKVQDNSVLLRQLDPKQRKALTLFSKSDTIISAQLGKLFNFKPRTSSQLAHTWVEEGFLEIVDHSKKGRKYRLAESYKKLL